MHIIPIIQKLLLQILFYSSSLSPIPKFAMLSRILVRVNLVASQGMSLYNLHIGKYSIHPFYVYINLDELLHDYHNNNMVKMILDPLLL